MRDSKQEIIRFWFEETPASVRFQRNAEFDSMVVDRFRVTYDMSGDGLCDDWSSDALGCLALCLLFDQLPRRMFRGQAKAYATDHKALMYAKKAIKSGYDQLLDHEKRFYIYLPFEHSEDMADQKRNLELFKSMQRENPVAYQMAQKKFDIFKKFGRFPHRNKDLGRMTTPEEQEFIDQTGEVFGV